MNGVVLPCGGCGQRLRMPVQAATVRCPSCGLQARHKPSLWEQAKAVGNDYLDRALWVVQMGFYAALPVQVAVWIYFAVPMHVAGPSVLYSGTTLAPGIVLGTSGYLARRYPEKTKFVISVLTGLFLGWLMKSLWEYNEGRKADTWGTADRITEDMIGKVRR